MSTPFAITNGRAFCRTSPALTSLRAALAETIAGWDDRLHTLRATEAADDATVAAIRGHLQEIVEEFEKGDFSTPQFVHGYAPDGVAELAKLRSAIAYRYQRVDGGGRIRITTQSAEALAAIHAFLRFQVIEHRTANSGEVEEDD